MELSRELAIEAPKEAVWAILSDLTSLEKYDAAVERSYYVTAERSGLDAARHCDLAGGESLRERVIDWQEGEGYLIEVYDDKTTGFPLQDQKARFSLESKPGGSSVRMTYYYAIKPSEAVSAGEAEALAAEIVEGVLGGLKQYAETGAPVLAGP